MFSTLVSQLATHEGLFSDLFGVLAAYGYHDAPVFQLFCPKLQLSKYFTGFQVDDLYALHTVIANDAASGGIIEI